MAKLIAPWTAEQVEALNFYQEIGIAHPFTCGGVIDGIDCRRDLIATENGWICPDPACSYTQDWCHSFMADKAQLEAIIASSPIHRLIRERKAQRKAAESNE